METLTLKGLHFHAPHGYHKEERISGNDFEVDLIISGPLRKAGETDNISDTVDYQKIEHAVSTVMQGPSVQLIESLAYKIGEKIFSEHIEIATLKVAVRKLNPPLEIQTDYSEITMSWQR